MSDDWLFELRDTFVRDGIPEEVRRRCVANARHARQLAIRNAVTQVFHALRAVPAMVAGVCGQAVGRRPAGAKTQSPSIGSGGYRMIIREWRGRASSRGDAYPLHFRSKVVPELRLLDGFIGAHLARRSHAGGFEYLVLTRWRSLEAVRGFAGADVDKAIVEPGAVAALDQFDASVQHYEIIEEVDPR
jgi:heme-degrading monooxygenase HmoA